MREIEIGMGGRIASGRETRGTIAGIGNECLPLLYHLRVPVTVATVSENATYHPTLAGVAAHRLVAHPSNAKTSAAHHHPRLPVATTRAPVLLPHGAEHGETILVPAPVLVHPPGLVRSRPTVVLLGAGAGTVARPQPAQPEAAPFLVLPAAGPHLRLVKRDVVALSLAHPLRPPGEVGTDGTQACRGRHHPHTGGPTGVLLERRGAGARASLLHLPENAQGVVRPIPQCLSAPLARGVIKMTTSSSSMSSLFSVMYPF